MEELFLFLVSRKLTLSSCESYTGGLFAALFTEIPGSSQVFKGAIVAYANEVKTEVVGVSNDTIANYGALSEETVVEMARKTKANMHTDVCVAFSGNAGPGVSEHKKQGEVYMCIAYGNTTRVFHERIAGDRTEVRKQSVLNAARRIESLIREVDVPCEKGDGG